MKLVYKILLIFVLPLTIVSLFFVLFIHSLLYNVVEQRFLERIEDTSKDYASLINLRLQNIAEFALNNTRKIERTRKPSKRLIWDMLKETIQNDSLIYGASIFFDTTYNGNLSKTFFYSSRDINSITNTKFNYKDKEYSDYFSQEFSWWIVPKNTEKPFWTSPYYDAGAGNKLIITYANPFFIDNTYSGLVTIDVLVDDIGELLLINEKRIEGDYDPDLYVMNASDSILIFAEKQELTGIHAIKAGARSDNIFDKKETLSLLDLVLKPDSKPGIVKNRYDKSFFVFHSPVESCDWIVIDILQVSTAQKFVNSSIGNIVAFLIIFILLIIVLIFIASRLITKPISKLSGITQEISKGNYNNKIDIHRNDEIGTLATNFTKMASELQIREKKLKEANKQLLVLDEAKNGFLQLISHEIRTPLNGIVGSTYFLKDMIVDPELKEFLDMLKESVDRLDNFSKTALEITEMQTVGEKAERTEFKTNPVIRSVIEELKIKADEKHIKLDVNLCNNDSLIGVENYFRRSIWELIGNAIKYSFENTSIEILTFIENNKLCISVSDTGEIIPKEKIEEITKPFGLGKDHYDKDIGLGLTYIQKFLDIHNGSLKISSNKEKTKIVLLLNLTK